MKKLFAIFSIEPLTPEPITAPLTTPEPKKQQRQTTTRSTVSANTKVLPSGTVVIEANDNANKPTKKDVSAKNVSQDVVSQDVSEGAGFTTEWLNIVSTPKQLATLTKSHDVSEAEKGELFRRQESFYKIGVKGTQNILNTATLIKPKFAKGEGAALVASQLKLTERQVKEFFAAFRAVEKLEAG